MSLHVTNSRAPSTARHPTCYEDLDLKRGSDETASPSALSAFGPTVPARLASLVLGRSGDKGANINAAASPPATPPTSLGYGAFLTLACMAQLMGDDLQPKDCFIERIEYLHT
jgi:hypothetical protein